MHFYYILHKNSIGHLWGPHGIIFAPLPMFLEKKWTINLLYFYVHFRKAFAEFVVLFTKIWPKIWIIMESESCSQGCFELPPLYTKTWAMQFFFYI